MLVNVQVTSAPATRSMVATPVLRSVAPRGATETGERPARQAQALDHGVLTGEQLTERLGVRQGGVGVVVEREVAERGEEEREVLTLIRSRVRIASLTIVIEPNSVFVNLQVTLSPEFKVTKIVSTLAPKLGVHRSGR